jgi:hypothetical protein
LAFGPPKEAASLDFGTLTSDLIILRVFYWPSLAMSPIIQALGVYWTMTAYRCASGRANKADWESLELEDVDLVLG